MQKPRLNLYSQNENIDPVGVHELTVKIHDPDDITGVDPREDKITFSSQSSLDRQRIRAVCDFDYINTAVFGQTFDILGYT